jgi:hypothetical protein
MKKGKITAFVARLEQQKATPEMVKKYVAEYEKLLFYRQHQEAQLGLHADHIQMAELRDKDNLRILDEYRLLQRLASGCKISFVIYPKIDRQTNLVGNHRACKYKNDLPPVEVLNGHKSFRPIGKISVWQEPLEGDKPCLTLEQIIAQIPHGLVGRTKAVCLLSEEKNFFEDTYDIYMSCHKYNIWLFG